MEKRSSGSIDSNKNFVFQLFVTGGSNFDDNSETTTEFVDEDGSYLGPRLPWRFANHCITKIDESYAIMIGGSYKPRSTLIVKTRYEDWFDFSQIGPDLIGDGRTEHACASIRHDNGSTYVIAVGGVINAVVLDTSEILEIEITSPFKWRQGKKTNYYLFFSLQSLYSHANFHFFQGPKLPQKCAHGTAVALPYPNSNQAVVIGCSDGTSATEKIFKLTWQDENLQWVTLQQKLNFPRHSAVAMLIPGTQCKYI